MAVTRNEAKNEIYLTDLGVTIRTLLGVAAKGYEVSKRRTWKLVYKEAYIGEVKVATNRNENATSDSNAGSDSES